MGSDGSIEGVGLAIGAGCSDIEGDGYFSGGGSRCIEGWAL